MSRPGASAPLRLPGAALSVAALLVAILSAACAAGRGVAPVPRVAVAPPRPSPSLWRAGVREGPGDGRVRDARRRRSPSTTTCSAPCGPSCAVHAPRRIASAMLDVQAIVSRTYALANLRRHAADGFDLCDTTHCQVYRAPVAPGARPTRADPRAVPSAHAGPGHHLRGPRDPGAVPRRLRRPHGVGGLGVGRHRRAVPRRRCRTGSAAGRPASGWTFAADETALVRALEARVPRTDVGRSLERIEVAERDASGRALAVTLVGARTLDGPGRGRSGAVMRQAFGERSIRSTWFTVVREGGRFVFTGVGAGHGVGLCQAGALRARRGPACPRPRSSPTTSPAPGCSRAARRDPPRCPTRPNAILPSPLRREPGNLVRCAAGRNTAAAVNGSELAGVDRGKSG